MYQKSKSGVVIGYESVEENSNVDALLDDLQDFCPSEFGPIWAYVGTTMNRRPSK